MSEGQITSGKLLAKNTLINFAGLVAPLSVGILTVPYAIQGLGKDGFGVLSIAWVILGYLGILDFGLSRATAKYISEIRQDRHTHQATDILWTSIITSLLFGLLGTVLVYFLTPFMVKNILNVPDGLMLEAMKTFYFFSYSLPFIMLTTSLRGVLSAIQRFDLVNIVFIPSNILTFIFPALSQPFHLSLSTVIMLIILSRVIMMFFYLYFCLREFPTFINKPLFKINTFKRLLSFGGWVTISSVISPLLVYADRFFIGTILSVEAVTYYTVPYDTLNRMRIIPIALMTTFFPEFSLNSANMQLKVLANLFSRSVKYILILTSLTGLILFYYAPEILKIWVGTEFSMNSTTIFRVICIGIIVNSVAYVPFNFLQGIGKPEWPAKFHLIELPLYMGLLFLLIRKIGLNGVAVAWLIRVIFDFLLQFIYSIKFTPQIKSNLIHQKIFHEIFMIVFFAFGLWAIKILIKNVAIAFLLILSLLLIIILLTWRYILDDQERLYMQKMVKKRF